MTPDELLKCEDEIREKIAAFVGEQEERTNFPATWLRAFELRVKRLNLAVIISRHHAACEQRIAELEKALEVVMRRKCNDGRPCWCSDHDYRKPHAWYCEQARAALGRKGGK